MQAAVANNERQVTRIPKPCSFRSLGFEKKREEDLPSSQQLTGCLNAVNSTSSSSNFGPNGVYSRSVFRNQVLCRSGLHLSSRLKKGSEGSLETSRSKSSTDAEKTVRPKVSNISSAAKPFRPIDNTYMYLLSS